MESSFRVIQGSCMNVLDTLAENVQCVVTSPPYFNCRNYGESEDEIGRETHPYDFVRTLCTVFSKIKIRLCDKGVVWVNLGDSIAKKNFPEKGGWPQIKKGEQMLVPTMFAFECRRDGWFVQQDVIWAKTNPVPSSTPKRCTPSHEYIFMLTKSEEYKFYPDRIMTEAKTNFRGKPQPPIGGVKRAGGDNSAYSGNTPEGTGLARKRDVWFETTSKCPDAHFAPFPVSIVEPCILSCTDANDLVLDPFSGTGTTGQVAKMHGRSFVGIELYDKYVEMSNAKKLKINE